MKHSQLLEIVPATTPELIARGIDNVCTPADDEKPKLLPVDEVAKIG